MKTWSETWRRAAIDALLSATKPAVADRLRLFRKLEGASPEAVDEYQRQRLRDLMRHCLANVPYYRQPIESANLDLSDGFSVDQLSRLPVLTKDIIRQEGANLHSRDRLERGVFENSSGGSTGRPIVFLQDRLFYASSVIAAKFIYNQFLGKEPGAAEVNLWGSERDIHRSRLGLKQRAINFLYNRKFQNCFLVNDDKLHAFVQEINEFKPASIWAYVESADLLAKFVERNKLSVHSPQYIITTAGCLFPAVRENLENVFGCPVFNQYGSREFGAIAVETHDQDGMRGFPYLNYTEIVDGKVVITCLTNYSMPFIRYEIGDTAEPWSGPCNSVFGCQRKLFQTITGRVHSHFRTARGELVHGLFFTHQFYFLDWVSQFQIVQESVDHICCYLVPTDEPVMAELDRIRSRIHDAMGTCCEIEFHFVDRILPAASGKHLYTVSKVENPAFAC